MAALPLLALLVVLAGRGALGQLAAKPTRGPHPSSPCPSVFSYEGREPENNRWHGVVLVSTDEVLDGMRLSVRLTHRAQILGNYIGDVITNDNVEFTILSLKQRLSPGPPLPVRIFTTFGDRDDIPYVANIKLNGRTICGSVRADSEPGSLATSLAPSRIGKPPGGRPAGIGGAGAAGGAGGAGGGAGGAVGAGSGLSGSGGVAGGHAFVEEVIGAPARPAATLPPPRPTQPTAPSRPTPVYEPPPSANPDNYYPSNSVNSNEPPAYNQYESATKRPARPGSAAEADAYRPSQPVLNYSTSTEPERGVYRPPIKRPPAPPAARPDEIDVYRPDRNYTSTAEPERGVYRPTASTEYAPPPPAKYPSQATDRPGPVYTQKYAPTASTEADDYRTTRVAAPTRTPPSARPASSLPPVERRPAVSPNADLTPVPPRPGRPSRPHFEEAEGPGRPSLDSAPEEPPLRPRPQRSACGTIAPPATPLIINGETSIPGKWPWHVALYKPHGRDWKYQCGGSLISPTVVVTAAHCVTTSVGRPVGPESLLVFLGKHALRTTTEDGVQDKHVYFIHVHPGYNYTNYRNDIAVLVLSSPASITSAVRPVCLWDKDKTDLASVEGKFGTVVGWRTDLAQPETDSDKVVGWGIETDGLLTEELHQALMPVVSPAICVYSYPAFFGVYTNNQTYCAGYSPDQPAAGTSVCNGDSGGGMFFKQDESAPDDEAVWMLRGLVSLSVRTKQDRCDPSHFVVFTDVAKYVDWLENFLVP